jgi:hypothetical protein
MNFVAELSLVTVSDMTDTASTYHTSFIRVIRNRVVQHTSCTTDGSTLCAPSDVGVLINSASSSAMSSMTTVNFEVTFPSVMDSTELFTDLTAFFADESSRGFGAQMPRKNGEFIASEPLHVDEGRSLNYGQALAAIFIVLIVLASVISTCVCGPIVCVTAIIGIVCCVCKKGKASAVAPAPASNPRASGGVAMVDILDAKVVPEQVVAIDCVVLGKEMA